MDYNQAMQQIQAMQMYRRMLGLDQAQGGMSQQPPQMQYVGMGQGGQQQQKQSSNPMSTYNNVMKMMGGGTTATGMTPNATNPAGESFYGWGAQTGDWGATASPAMYDTNVAASVPVAESGVGGEAASGMGYGTVGAIAAAIAGQHMMSGATDRRTLNGKALSSAGHRTGDIFSGDMFTEPWMAFGEQKLGVDTPTAGEKTDEAFNRIRQGEGGYGDLLGSVPGTAYQWFDPFGTFFQDVLTDKFGDAGKVASSLILPGAGMKFAADWFGKLF